MPVPALAPVEELRLRLYRLDPPAGALAAYLDALGGLAPAPAPTTGRPPRRANRSTAIAGLLVVAVLAASVAALAASLGAVPRAPVAHARSAPSSARMAPPPVPGIPLGSLLGGPSTSGRFDAVGRTVVVSVDCIGDGTLSLTIADDPPTVLTCEAGGPGFAMLRSTGPLERFTVALARDGDVRWSLAVGTMPGT